MKQLCFYAYHTEIHTCLVLSPQHGLYSFRAQNKVERLTLVDPGVSRGVTDLYPSREYTPHNTRDRSITRTRSLQR